MDIEQFVARLEWLEDERRKDKLTISTLQERLASLESSLPGMVQQIKDLTGDLARLTASLARIDQVESAIAQVRVEFSRTLDTSERTRAEHDREVDRARQGDMDVVNKSFAELRKSIETIGELRRGLQSRTEEDFRLSRLIEELEQKVTQTRRSDDEYRHAQKLIEDGQRQEAKRVTDLQGEVAAMRKRMEEQRGKLDVTVDTLRKVETRLADFQTTEGERRQAQVAFIEKQNMLNVDRDRTWKEWQTRFEQIDSVSTNLDTQLQSLDATHRAIKRAQEGFEEITQRFERRINEITEMQRLSEDRFRQEWVGFRADDQKRWTNYTLSQEEQQREAGRQYDKLVERMTLIEESTHELNDALTQNAEQTLKRLQGLMALSREWLEMQEQNGNALRS
ncbi:MAG TPA: hypothetical protein PLA25_10885 [Anaerolineaceae bacterium]|nr:hypothetical protein [Anaerolineaceae bacterium]